LKIIFDTQKTEDASLFGEALRDYAFIKENKYDLGCYSTFKLKDEFLKVGKESALGKELLKYLDDDQDIEVYSNTEIHLAWYWDGDGTLLIKEGNRVAINNDCKRDGWKWI